MTRVRASRQVALIAGMTLWTACGSDIPTGPSELAEGIVVFVDTDYRGRWAHFTKDVADLKDVDGPCLISNYSTDDYDETWNDCISSVRIAPGWRATLFGDTNYRGGQFEVTSDVPNLKTVSGSCGSGFNDCVSSIRVSRAQ
jgi:hypothetical protein